MSELRTLLEDTVQRLFREQVPQELLETAEEGEWPAELWKTVEETGLTRPNLPEDAGGAGGSWGDAYAVIRAAGYYAVPLPIAETILGGWLLTCAGIEVPEGPLALLPLTLPIEVINDGKLTCSAERVPWGKHARHAVFVVEGGDGRSVGLVETNGATIAPGENIAREPRDDLDFSSAPIAALNPAALPENAMELFGAMIRTSQMAGALEALLDLSVQYAGERIQFGRPIAKFQIIQQELARLAGETAASGTAAQAAFRAADRFGAVSAGGGGASPDSTFEIACAKVRVGEAAGIGPGIAHQTLGAIGFTYEHRLHFSTRRLWAWRAEFGSESHWSALLGREAIDQGPEALWPFITSR